VLRFLLFIASIAHAAEIKGRVVDAATNEPIARALVRAGGDTITTADGRFAFDATASELQVSCVGYRPFRMPLGQPGEYEIRLVPDTLRRDESVDVVAPVFTQEVSVNLAGQELRNLASVIADDPLRAVQGLPGVTSNDDFQSQPSLRGAGFDRLGVYLDGVLLHSPFHTVQGDPGAGSLTLLSSDMLDQVELHSGPIPVSFADRGAGAIDMRYRDGDRNRHRVRVSASASNAGVSLEGPFQKGRGAWLASVRKSYLQYLINSTSDEAGLAFGFWDAQARLSYDISRRHRASLSLLHGKSALDREAVANALGLNSILKTDYSMVIVNAGSRWTPTGGFLFQNNFAWMRERFANINRQALPIGGGHYGEWVWNSDNSWQTGEHSTLYFGANIRRLRDDFYFNGIQPGVVRIDQASGTAKRAGAHIAQEFRLWNGRVQLRAGARADGHSIVPGRQFTPVASIGFTPLSKTRLTMQWGQNAQFPEIAQLLARIGNRTLSPIRTAHVLGAIEQRLNEQTRLRFEVWRRHDRQLLYRPGFEPRQLNNRYVAGSILAPWRNTQNGEARGMQVFLQRRSANRLSGWLSYAYTQADVTDVQTSPADFDQRHTANVFATYRIRPTVNLSSRFSYGSGFPLRGFYRVEAGNNFFLAAQRNQLRVPSYHRWDLRANKTYVKKAWHLTLFAEVVNIYNHRNVRFDDFRSIDPRTGAARLGFDRMFPILPSAGLAAEF